MKVAVLLAVVAALASCGESTREPEGITSCGRYTSLNRPLTVRQREMNRCFVDAFRRGEPARLVVTLATVEGDPITSRLTVLGERRLRAVVDTSKDRFGDGRTYWVHCTGVTTTRFGIHPTGCD